MSWTQIPTSQLPTNYNWISLASNSSGNTLLATATQPGNRGVYLSTDGGINWTQVIVNIGSSVASNSDGTTLLAGTNGSGVYLSTNGGSNWTQISNSQLPTSNTWTSLASDSTGSKLLAGTGAGGVYRSTNGGTTWTQIPTLQLPTSNFWQSLASDSTGSKLLASTNASGVYQSTNGGTTWTQILNSQLPTSNNWKCVASNSDGTKLLACSINSGGVYQSIDGGTTWTQISNSQLPTSNNWTSVASDSAGTKLLAVKTNGVYQSTDGGTNWTITNGIPASNNWTCAASNSSGTKLLAGSYGFGVYIFSQENIVCFNQDTLILTDKGYIKIQELRPGNLVQTVSNGFKPIHSIGKKDIYHLASSERIKDQLYLCSKEHYPELFEDLVITGCHAILVPQFKDDEQREKTKEVLKQIYVTDGYYRLPACVDERSSVYSEAGNNTIYHFALENNDYYMNYGVYANGLLVETCSKRYLNELSGMELLE